MRGVGLQRHSRARRSASAAPARTASGRWMRSRALGEVGGVKVLLAAPRSFCAGVDRAIEIVERLLDAHGPPIYVRHEIVHNDNVVRRLEGLGAVFVDSEDDIPPGEICVLSAHGVAPSVRENCQRAACASSMPSARSCRRYTPRRAGTRTRATSSPSSATPTTWR